MLQECAEDFSVFVGEAAWIYREALAGFEVGEFAGFLEGDVELAVTKALAHLRKQRHDVLVFQTLDPAEIDLTFKKPCELRDLETGERLPVNPRGLADEYRKVFGAFLEQYRKACAGMNIDYRLVRTDQALESFVRAYLEERRRLSR